MIIAAATALAYANSFFGVFIFDDRNAILENETIRSLWPIWRSFWGPDETGVSGRPFLNFTFALNHAISGYDIWSYHLLNLAIHILAALALYGLVRRTLGLLSLRASFGNDVSSFAFAASALWALHPIQTQSVTYIIARNESLMGLFYLLTLYCFSRSLEENSAARRWRMAAVAACFLGMASKETMATAPIVVFLYDRCFAAGSFAEAARRRGWLHAAIASSWVLLAILIASGPRQGSTGFGLDSSSPMKYFLIECGVVLRYLGLSVWPHPLVFDYGWALPGPPRDFAAPLAILVALGAATLWALWRRPAMGFLGASFFIILAPTSSFMPTVEPCWEYRMYLPLAAVLILLLLAARRIAQPLLAGSRHPITEPSSPNQNPGAAQPPSAVIRRWLVPAALFSVAALFAAMTLRRNADYRSEETLFERSIARHPINPRGLNNLGTQAMRARDADRAESHLRRSVEMYPKYAEAHANLGAAQFILGKLPEARASLALSLELNPNQPKALNNLGMVLLELGQGQEALARFEEALAQNPKLEEARLNRARALEALSRASPSVPRQ